MWEQLRQSASIISSEIRDERHKILVSSQENVGEGEIGSMWIVYNQDLSVFADPFTTFVAVHVCPQTGELIVARNKRDAGQRILLSQLGDTPRAPIDQYHVIYQTLLSESTAVMLTHSQHREYDMMMRLTNKTGGIGFPNFSEIYWKILQTSAKFGVEMWFITRTQGEYVKEAKSEHSFVLGHEHDGELQLLFLGSSRLTFTRRADDDFLQIRSKGEEEVLIMGSPESVRNIVYTAASGGSRDILFGNYDERMVLFSIPEETMQGIKPYIPVVPPAPFTMIDVSQSGVSL